MASVLCCQQLWDLPLRMRNRYGVGKINNPQRPSYLGLSLRAMSGEGPGTRNGVQPPKRPTASYTCRGGGRTCLTKYTMPGCFPWPPSGHKGVEVNGQIEYTTHNRFQKEKGVGAGSGGGAKLLFRSIQKVPCKGPTAKCACHPHSWRGGVK